MIYKINMSKIDPRELEARNLEAHISAIRTDGLVNNLFYRDRAIKIILSNQNHPEYHSMRKSLMRILNGKDPTMNLNKQAVSAQVDSIPPKEEHGFLPMAMVASAGMYQEIAAVNFLAPLSVADNDVYKLLWKVAMGETSEMINVSDAAIKSLSWRAFPDRKGDLKRVALNPTRKTEDRILAYKIMAGAAMFNDPEVYEIICDIASDTSIKKLYENIGILAPSARFWFNFDMKRRKQYPNHYQDGKSEAQVKNDVVERVQREFQENLFKVVDYVLKTTDITDLWNNDQAKNNLQKEFPQTTQRLTKELCDLVVASPSYQVQTLCKYARKMRKLSKSEAKHVVETLEQVRPYFAQHDFNQLGWIDGTLNKVKYILSKKNDGYIDILHLDKI